MIVLIVHTLLTSQPDEMQASINSAQPVVWHACSNNDICVSDSSDGNLSTSVGERNARRNASMSFFDNALARLCLKTNGQLCFYLFINIFIIEANICEQWRLINYNPLNEWHLHADRHSTSTSVPPLLTAAVSSLNRWISKFELQRIKMTNEYKNSWMNVWVF